MTSHLGDVSRSSSPNRKQDSRSTLRLHFGRYGAIVDDNFWEEIADQRTLPPLRRPPAPLLGGAVEDSIGVGAVPAAFLPVLLSHLRGGLEPLFVPLDWRGTGG